MFAVLWYSVVSFSSKSPIFASSTFSGQIQIETEEKISSYQPCGERELIFRCAFCVKTEENAWTCGYLVLTFGKWYSGPCFEIIILDSESLWTCARCVQDTVIRKRAEVTAGGKSTIHVRRVAFELSNGSGEFSWIMCEYAYSLLYCIVCIVLSICGRGGLYL